MRTSASALDGPRLKIERAKHHINDLNAKLDTFLSKKPFEVVVRQKLKSADREIAIKTKITIPPEFSLIIGDAIHNLRTALDITIFDLIGHLSTKPEAVQFPFAKNMQALESSMKSRQIEKAGKEVVTAVRDLQPYDGGNNLLYGLHALDISDKHKMILTAGIAANVVADDLRRFDPALDRLHGPGVLVFTNLDDGVMFRLLTAGLNRAGRRAQRGSEQKTEFQPEFTIAFAPAQPFHHAMVIPKLLEITGEVERAILKILKASGN